MLLVIYVVTMCMMTLVMSLMMMMFCNDVDNEFVRSMDFNNNGCNHCGNKVGNRCGTDLVLFVL